jgi:hypothetical protein
MSAAHAGMSLLGVANVYEHRGHAPVPFAHFVLRLLRHFLVAAGLLIVSLAVGMLGYQHFEHLEWRDAFLNASMLLGGMGPVNAPVTPAGKLFAGVFALYAGLLFVITAGILLAPVAHRFLHLFHCDGRN